ncbi:MAG: IS66 family transposase [Verrucomicrobia bacterium]|nr:IS66 family transposase [Verrucomicrobiota bacterium]
MKITSQLFEAFLKCPTKCYLCSLGETGSRNEYAEWVRVQEESYQREAALRLQEEVPETERLVAPPATEDLKNAKWRLAVDVVAQTPCRSADSLVRESQPNVETRGLGGPRSEQQLESRLHAVERVPSEGRGKPAQFVPIRFVFRNKLTKDDRLLLAFDALVLSQVLARESSLGKIIHGDDRAMLKVKLGARTAESARTSVTSKGLAAEVRKRLEKMIVLLCSSTTSRNADSTVRESDADGEETRGLGGPRSAPDLVLNRHCAECEFQARCRKIAVEKDDLSLLAGMSAKERQQLRSKGIFTVTQLSYTFRPRRRPKRLRDKREKYHHSLKALAIREKKIHIVGSPELKIEGTPVYLDVEGLPDRDFYYLIGLRIRQGESAVQHSLWADTVADEGRIWREFLAILETVEKPVLIHYGSYETTFLKQMEARYGSPPEGSLVARAMAPAINVVSVMFAQTYFPTYSNGLKEVAGWLGFRWSEAGSSGKQTVVWRNRWDKTQDSAFKEKVVTYNTEDCKALALLIDAISGLAVRGGVQAATGKEAEVINTEDLKHLLVNKWREFSSPLSELEFVTKAAYWDYQRDRIYVRSSKRLKRLRSIAKPDAKIMWRVDKVVRSEDSRQCPRCMRKGVKRGGVRSKRIQEILFGRSSLKRRVFRYEYQPYWCSKCKATFGDYENRLGPGNHPKCGRSVHALFFYQVIELCIPVRIVAQELGRLLGLHLNSSAFAFWKRDMAAYYSQTQQQILERIVSGGVVHADETHASVQGKRAYVWVFTNMHEVAYLYSDGREGEMAQATLREFKGVLISDFYAVYDSFNCPQQKCLIHLVRDLNGAMLDDPYDEEMKHIVTSFGQLLKTIVEDVDRRGLKKRFLRKHVAAVGRFYRKVVVRDYESPRALTCVERFEKNRDKLFTFLNYDGVPWNNNNAEHAIKAFAKLREHLGGCSTEKGLKEYLTLLSVCQTCKYMGVDFLDFLRSGEKDIHAFAESRRGRRRRTDPSQPPDLPADAIPDPGSPP